MVDHEYRQECECGGTTSAAAKYCPWCGDSLIDDETSNSDGYVDIRELHPACVMLPCRYEGCDNERWVCGSGSNKDYTICEECYDGPDVTKHLSKPTVRL